MYLKEVKRKLRLFNEGWPRVRRGARQTLALSPAERRLSFCTADPASHAAHAGAARLHRITVPSLLEGAMSTPLMAAYATDP